MSKRISSYLVVAIVVVLVGTLVLKQRSNANTATFDIETTTVETGEVARVVAASGAVRALTTVEVGSQVSGQITALNADFNSAVNAGDIIARIDPQTFESRVESANADVQSARASIAVQKASIVSAAAVLAQAEKDYARQQALYATNAVAQSTLEDTELALAVARANVDVSRAQLSASNATLAQRHAALTSAQVDLERTIIRSPIDGVVISRSVDVGQTVAASFSAPILFTIAQDLQDIRIDAAVVEADIGGIDSGDIAQFTVDAYPDHSFKGTVEQVRLAAEILQNVVTYTVVIKAENPNGWLLPGMTANVEITADKRDSVLRLGEAAVRFRPPANGPEVLEATQDESQPARGSGGSRGTAGLQLLNDLDIDQAKKTVIQNELQAVAQAARESTGDRARPDRAGMRERMQAITNNVLRSNLTDDEYKQVQGAISERASVTRVDAYKTTADGQLEKQTLTLGLQDGSYVEILRGAEVGDTFVTSARAVQTGK